MNAHSERILFAACSVSADLGTRSVRAQETTDCRWASCCGWRGAKGK